MVQLIDRHDARATVVHITATGRALRSQQERLTELLDTLSSDEEATLGLAIRVALPLITKLTRSWVL